MRTAVQCHKGSAIQVKHYHHGVLGGYFRIRNNAAIIISCFFCICVEPKTRVYFFSHSCFLLCVKVLIFQQSALTILSWLNFYSLSYVYFLRIFSVVLPFASSSTSLSR